MNVAKCVKLLDYSLKNPTTSTIIRRYAFKSDLQIKWVRPEKIPCHKAAASGDLKPMPEVDGNQFRVEFRGSKELQTADEIVQRLFTLEFAPHSKTVHSYLKDLSSKVQRHEYDSGSIESKLAKWTGAIRAMQEIMEEYPRNKRLKVKLKELIDRRKKHLKYLRKWDYKKFEWLIDNLNIVYKPPPKEFHWITRKESLQKLTKKHCDNVIKDKFEVYKLALQAEQPAFLEEKIRSLEFIRSEQQSCGVDVTVTEEEINGIKQQLVDLLKRRDKSVDED